MTAGTGTLLLRLAGPMQSWGTRSRFDHRDTEREPTKSGVIGLICAALGKPRDEVAGTWPTLAELADLRMGVRVLAEGDLAVDYQTVGGGQFGRLRKFGVWRASGSIGGTVVSRRHFLADADFLVGLQGPTTLLEPIHAALHSPVWPLSLGRKSYVPSIPVGLPETPPEGPGLRTVPLRAALEAYQGKRHHKRAGHDRLILEIPVEGAVETRMDVPLSFQTRSFGVRGVETAYLEVHGD